MDFPYTAENKRSLLTTRGIHLFLCCLVAVIHLTAGYDYQHACPGYPLALQCISPNVIYVLNATYGQNPNCGEACCAPGEEDCKVYVDMVDGNGTLAEIQNECNGKDQCTISVLSADLSQWCSLQPADYQEVYYTCGPPGGLPTTTTTTTALPTTVVASTTHKVTTEDEGNGGGGGNNNTGAIVGGVIGGLLVLALFTVIIFFVIRNYRNNKGAKAGVVRKSPSRPTSHVQSTTDEDDEDVWKDPNSGPLTRVSMNGSYDNQVFHMQDETSANATPNGKPAKALDPKSTPKQEMELVSKPQEEADGKREGKAANGVALKGTKETSKSNGKAANEAEPKRTKETPKRPSGASPQKPTASPPKKPTDGTDAVQSTAPPSEAKPRAPKPPRPKQAKPKKQAISSSTPKRTAGEAEPNTNKTDDQKISTPETQPTEEVKQVKVKSKEQSAKVKNKDGYEPLDISTATASTESAKDNDYTPLQSESSEKKDEQLEDKQDNKESEYESIETTTTSS